MSTTLMVNDKKGCKSVLICVILGISVLNFWESRIEADYVKMIKSEYLDVCIPYVMYLGHKTHFRIGNFQTL